MVNINAQEDDSFLVYDLKQNEIVLGESNKKLKAGSLYYPFIIKLAEKAFEDDDLLRVSASAIGRTKNNVLKLNEELKFKDLKKLAILNQSEEIVYTIAENTSTDIKKFNLLLKNALNIEGIKLDHFNDLVSENNLMTLDDVIKLYLKIIDQQEILEILNMESLNISSSNKSEKRELFFKNYLNDKIVFLYEDKLQNNLVFKYVDDNLELLVVSTNVHKIDKDKLINNIINKLETKYFVLNLKKLKPYSYNYQEFFINHYNIYFNVEKDDLIYFKNESDLNLKYNLENKESIENSKLTISIYNKDELIKTINTVKQIEIDPDYEKNKNNVLVALSLAIVLLVVSIWMIVRKINKM